MLMLPPPEPPSHSGLTLRELVEYHRTLVSYYQHALLQATEQLYRAESILNLIISVRNLFMTLQD